MAVHVSDFESKHTLSALLEHANDNPVHTAVSGANNSNGQDDQVGRWRVKGTEFSLSVDRRSKSRMLEDLRCVFHQPRLRTTVSPRASVFHTSAMVRPRCHTLLHDGTVHTCCDPEGVIVFFICSFPAPVVVA